MENRSTHNGWPGSPSRVTCSTAPGLVTITLSGEIDLLAADALEAALATAADAQPSDVVVDLTGVTFIGSQALSFLVRLHHLTAEEGRLTTLQRVPPLVRKAMVTVGLDLLFALDGPAAERSESEHR
ncbi:STAS domain-containing protein [Cryptosporangium aurantiacum]|uniref:Anti-sigma B factor antagonist n=1 Tax=Cryptosporangium aurantiacum TaxID=134849 RepID=A0A1M7R944_9ACTN|nr:STAS domain-containing protein [Cryptosporangium aurantiacum]SHN42692.1 anti-sigma B factor antagonist [Cryptosporangium aurantiacum]